MKQYSIALSVVAALLLSSCAAFKNFTEKPRTDTVTVENVKTDKTDKESNREHSDINRTKNLTVEQLTNGQWTISAIGSRTVVAEDNAPYIVFASDGRFYAGDGCNVLNGDFVLRSDGKLIFNNVLSTMQFCPDVPYADMLAPIISDGASYNVDYRCIDGDTFLFLNDANGKSALKLRRHSLEFLNGNWQITRAEGKEINDEEANIFIDIAALKVHGNTGCNFFNGDLYLDPSRSDAIDFSNMGITRMACYKAEQNRAIMVALEQTVSAKTGKNDNIAIFLDGNGKEQMTLKRIILPNND